MSINSQTQTGKQSELSVISMLHKYAIVYEHNEKILLNQILVEATNFIGLYRVNQCNKYNSDEQTTLVVSCNCVCHFDTCLNIFLAQQNGRKLRLIILSKLQFGSN